MDVAPSTGFASYQDNLGATKNTGYELSISAPIIRNRRKKYILVIVIQYVGHYENVITRLSPAIEVLNNANDTAGVRQKSPLARYEVGESMSRIWAVRSLGIDPATGKEIFLKRDGSKTFIWDPKDKVVCGDATAKLKGMFSSNFNYKGVTFNITMSYQYGGQMYNQTLVDKIENVDLRKRMLMKGCLLRGGKNQVILLLLRALLPMAQMVCKRLMQHHVLFRTIIS